MISKQMVLEPLEKEVVTTKNLGGVTENKKPVLNEFLSVHHGASPPDST